LKRENNNIYYLTMPLNYSDMKKIKTLLSSIAIWCTILVCSAQNYSNGVFILNEDWFGQNNSTINFLNTETGEFDYLIIQEHNMDNMLSLGCTAQFGTVYGDNIYIISKQDQDDGEGIYIGGRVVVADAKTMKIKKSIPVIAYADNGKSMADGRAFVGVDEKKGYIGTSNGIYILSLESFEVEGRIEGSENPLITGEESNADGNGPLYRNQIGIMIRTHDYVFAIQEDKGVLVINAETDEIVNVINGCFSTMTQSKDGNIWVAVNTNMDYQEYPYGLVGEKWLGNKLLKINPETLETEYVDLSMGGINQTWYAWTAGSLCASAHENVLYFVYNPDQWNWFITSEMYKYDIDNGTLSKIFDSVTQSRYFYGAGIRVNPLDDKIYATLYKGNNDQSYWIYQMESDGSILNEYEPIQRYWFPAMPIFPDNHAPTVSDFDTVYLDNMVTSVIDLSEKAHDTDNLDAAITTKIISISNKDLITSELKNNKLSVAAKEDKFGNCKITIRFNSNGRIVDKELEISVSIITGIAQDPVEKENVYAKAGSICIDNVTSGTLVEIYNIHGQIISSQKAIDSVIIKEINTNGIYFVKIGNKTFKVIISY